MCGIFTVTSGFKVPAAPDPGRLTEAFAALAAAAPAWSEEALARMEAFRAECLRWPRPEGFLKAATDAAAAQAIEGAASGVEKWMAGLERVIESPDAPKQAQVETLHTLMTAGKDAVWQLRRDVLDNRAKVADLLAGAQNADGAALYHGWVLNLILNNIDRLEVRGRDSAGVGVYVRFADPAALEAFLDAGRREVFDERARIEAFAHLSVARPQTAPAALLFVFKVAEEVGQMGDNVRFLRAAISGDRLFQDALRVPGIAIQALGHTRWASNGVISVPNCHPVDGAILGGAGAVGRGAVVAALNGDIDNFQELLKKYVSGKGAALERAVTTDAKIIPVVVAEHMKTSATFEEAFSKAFDEFEGSMAIALMAADRPGDFICAQKGSGQGLFLGFAGETVAIASEMYGLVELTPDYLKADGERQAGGRVAGETFLVRSAGGEVLRLPERKAPDASARRTAEITTRDINRGDFPHFLLKEITESVRSVERTIRGKVAFDAAKGEAGVLLDETVLPADLIDELKSGRLRRIVGIGQGTAAIAADGIVRLIEANLRGTAIGVSSMKATELSSHYMLPDMSDTLIVAVSQSGTTTDTNRTVDLARERGARVVAIVNRRNSDLVYKSDGVLYTSDGRDIEMSVASTKAFYGQNVAGEILALAFADALGLLDPKQRFEQVKALLELPDAMRRMLERSDEIRRIAEATALKKRYWAVVGTGFGRIAADEIRIKLSELCYKAIAVDYLEDKKHIDLSSEPLILVCASGLPEVAVSDAVKEAAIFKAHDSLPIVIADEGETRFDPYAAFVVRVPQYEGELSYLLPIMAGHLYGYHAARAFDKKADSLKKLRTSVVKVLESGAVDPGSTDIWRLHAGAEGVVSEAVEVQRLIDSGEVDSGLEVKTATRLSTLIDFFLGRISIDEYFREKYDRRGTLGNLLDGLLESLSDAINELARPIDAIKHQAKTVTVGISRQIERPSEGILWSVFKEAGVDPVLVNAGHANIITALEPLVRGVSGGTVYSISGLTPIGKPKPSSTIRVEKKFGEAAKIASRCDAGRPLSGTKWGVVADRRVYLGRGQNDRRRILIVPAIGQSPNGTLVLYHLELAEAGDREARMAALKQMRERYKQVLISVTEATNREWDPAMIDKLTNDQLFFDDPAKLAARLK